MARTKEFSEEDVLGKAMDLFWRTGYHGASMQDVVEHLGISRSSLYDTFGDKRQLFLRALDRYRQQLSGAMIKRVNEATAVVPVIQALFDSAVQESMDCSPARGCFMVNTAVELASRDPEVARLVEANQQDVENAFEQAVRKGQGQGEIPARLDARTVARYLFNHVSGLRVAVKSGRNDPQEWAAVRDLVLSVLR